MTSELKDFMPLPRGVIDLELSGTALLIYAALLDRATLSRKNGWADEAGRVFVIYPVENLGKNLHLSYSAVKRHLKTLEAKGLLWKDRPKGNSANRIFLNLPEVTPQEVRAEPPEGSKPPPSRVQNRPPNELNKRTKYNFNYQYKEDESL